MRFTPRARCSGRPTTPITQQRRCRRRFHHQFELKHEFLALMLGVRRASVSQAAEAMQDAGLIRYRRAKITILDRAGLERAVCECHQTDRVDFERLLPQVLPLPALSLANASQPSSLSNR